MREFSELLTFCLLGLSVLQESRAYNFVVIAITVFATVVARGCHVFPLAFFLNLKRSADVKITVPMQFAIWNAGLRGAVAYALGVALDKENPNRSLIITTIHAVVLFTMTFHGLLTTPLLSFLKLKDVVIPPRPPKKKEKLHGMWSGFDKNFIIPFISYPRQSPTSEPNTDVQLDELDIEEKGTSEVFPEETESTPNVPLDELDSTEYKHNEGQMKAIHSLERSLSDDSIRVEL